MLQGSRGGTELRVGGWVGVGVREGLLRKWHLSHVLEDGWAPPAGRHGEKAAGDSSRVGPRDSVVRPAIRLDR